MDFQQSVSFVGCTSMLIYGVWRKLTNTVSKVSRVSKVSEVGEQISRNMSSKSSNVIPALVGYKYPAKEHCMNVKSRFVTKKGAAAEKTSAFFIAGGEIEPIKYCDQTKAFRQNRYFYYLTGCNIPGSSVLFDFKSGKLTLFLPDVDEEDIMWSGFPMSVEAALKKFDVDEVLYASDAPELFANGLDAQFIYTTDLDNVHDSQISSKLIVGDEDLFSALNNARSIKDWYEVELLKKACEVTDTCHLAVMSALPIEKTEGHIHAEFTYHALRQGSKFQGYDPICCSGPSCSTLHYVDNDADMDGKRSVLIDAGAEWECYTADVTRCFPINGKWTKEHREIYDAVLDMQQTAMERIKHGASWDEIHLSAHKVLIKHLLKLGIFKSNFSVEEIYDRKASIAFFPHGLGHLLGMDTHDVGGREESELYDDDNPYFKFLRLRRPLVTGMVVTNEPGCYFNPFLIEEFLDKHPERKEVVDREVMDKYLYIGGVRIEDDLLVTKDGYECLSKITKDPEEIEKIVSEGIAKGRSHFHVLA
ncbi:unnamed protein product [Kluyveromyces dobzhanskii CBS 2104]|uniref:WGS project CCBQ000000000 data, contig 00012 n=1 Tax=Kluyveromyces dobzhanskii CBS 2104 TaxID=1427455 RepID=A0A0A8L0S7_9SACH|nr:unnamed protein product [Kluyveromyces dobzhanskii CBS 2104]